MASTVWKGHLTFGLVSMPVRLVRAARPERVKLRQLYRPRVPLEPREEEPPGWQPLETRSQPGAAVAAPEQVAANRPASTERPAAEPPAAAPVRRVFQSTDEGTPLSGHDLVKGYEYDKGQFVLVDEQELRSLVPQTSTEIQVVEFVRFQEIDPVYLETSYYVIPDENAEKAYALLLTAMRDSGYAAIGQLTMHRRDHVLIVRPGKRGLIAHTMFYPEEVRSTEEFRTDTSLVMPKELELAKTLIAALAQPFDPSRFKNAFRERLEALIQTRVDAQQTTRVETQPQPGPAQVIDIMDALRRSLSQAQRVSEETERKPASAETKRPKSTPASPKRKRS